MKGLQVGRIVHYVDEDGKHKAAMVTAIHDEASVSLQVFGPVPNPFPTVVLYSESGVLPNSWHWPERVTE